MDPNVENCKGTNIRIEHLNDFYRGNVPDYLCVWGIHKAVLEGDFPEVKKWIESGGCVNERTVDRGYSALHLAVIRNDLEVLEYLLTRDGIEVDCTCSEYRTPLLLATALVQIKSVEKLIRAGADVNVMNKDNCSPLHMSVHHPDICHLLIRHGALIDAVDGFGSTALEIAVRDNCLETMHMLLYYNADVNVTETYSTAFRTALVCGRVDAQWALLEYVDDFNELGDDYRWVRSIINFALLNNSPLVKDMIERGADVNYGDCLNVFEDSSAFSHCLRYVVDLSTFKMVWERLRYNNTKNTIDFLDFLNHDSKVPTFLQVIIESDNFETAVECFSKEVTYARFVIEFAKKKFNLDQLTALTCRLLEYGFRPSSYDIHEIFSNYGYCELFRILLYMDNDFTRGWLPHMALTRLIFDVRYDLNNVVNHVDYTPREGLLQLLEYFICPRLIDSLTFRYRRNKNLSDILSNLPKVPSLIELARNAARKQIWQSFNVTNTCQFYTIINHLDISAIYKEILTFKRKMYTVK